MWAIIAVCAIVALSGNGRAAAGPQHQDSPSVKHPCPDVQKAVTYYRSMYRQHRAQMGLSGPVSRVWYGCGSAARRAVEWRERASQARKALARWKADRRAWQYEWQRWLPDKFARVGACETGYGQRPGNWNHDSGTYVSAFGIIEAAYDDFSARMGYPGWDAGGRTPRQQYEVAAAIQRAYGWSAWGCGGA